MEAVKKVAPSVDVIFNDPQYMGGSYRAPPGGFEVSLDGDLIYSKVQQRAFPDPESLAVAVKSKVDGLEVPKVQAERW